MIKQLARWLTDGQRRLRPVVQPPSGSAVFDASPGVALTRSRQPGRTVVVLAASVRLTDGGGGVGDLLLRFRPSCPRCSSSCSSGFSCVPSPAPLHLSESACQLCGVARRSGVVASTSLVRAAYKVTDGRLDSPRFITVPVGGGNAKPASVPAKRAPPLTSRSATHLNP